MKLKTISQKATDDKRVLVRVDYNVPLKETNGSWQVANDSKLRATLPTIKLLLEAKAKQIILCSHLGRPKGKPAEKLSLKPVAKKLGELLKENNLTQVVDFAPSPSEISPESKLLLLENLRFDPGEKKNDPVFAKKLSGLADIYVNDAFSASHRQHASIVGIAKYLPSFAGLTLVEELQSLQRLLESPKRPFVVMVGGAKISDKLSAIEHLSKIADTILVGGGIANNFLKAEHFEVYHSYLEDAPADLNKEGMDFVKLADKLLDENRQQSTMLGNYPLPKILYPLDVLVASSPESKSSKTLNLLRTEQKKLGEESMFLDIGPKTIALYSEVIKKAKTVFWNGPMGVFENPEFENGTKKLAKVLSESKAFSVLGGGDTIRAIEHFSLRDDFSYVSNAGGAALEFLSGKMLPGLEPLTTSN